MFLLVRIPFRNLFRQPDVTQRPHRQVDHKNQRHIQILRQPHIHHRKQQRHCHNRDHRHPLRKTDSQQLMMNMILVRQERILTMTHAVEIHPHHITARHQQRRERQHHRVHPLRSLLAHRSHLHTQDTDNHTDGQTARIPHENLLLLLRITEHIVVEELHQNAQRSKRQHRIQILTQREIHNAEEQTRHAAQARSQAVDTVNEVERIDDKHRQQHRKRITDPSRHLPDKQRPVEIAHPQPTGNHHHPAENLNHKLRTVADTHQVVRHSREKQQHHRAIRERHRHPVLSNLVAQLMVTQHHIHAIQHHQRKHNHRLESNTAQTRHHARMDLPLINRIKQLLAESDQ